MKRFSIPALIVVMLALSIAAFAQIPGAGRGNRPGRQGGKIRTLDTNRDGRIERSEWTRKPKAFDRLDANHDGVITREELRARRAGRRR